MKEIILCAAIWYKDLTPLNPKKIRHELYLPNNIDEGIVFCGHRHPHCLYQMIAIYGCYQSRAGFEVQGFLTSGNRFVNRKEALKIALNANQIIDKDNIRGKQLYSEDLY